MAGADCRVPAGGENMVFTTQKICSMLLDIFLNTTEPVTAAAVLLFIAGEWGLLRKSGIRGWWALVPCARDYQLARCAGREPAGRTASILSFLIIITNTVMYFIKEDIALAFLVVIVITLNTMLYFYHLQIFSGLTEVYGARRRWIWLWLFSPTRWIPAMLWGWKKERQPLWKVEDLDLEMSRIVSGESAAVMDTGLTVNLKERSAWEFFRKKLLLQDIHMYIPQGHMVLLLGGSGAGKTTFVNAVNGYEKADAQVVLNGSDVYRNYKSMQYETGFVPQKELMRNKDTVYFTLADAALLRLPEDVPAELRKKRIEEVMEIFGLKPVRNSLVQKLSGGQKKRLSIAMELLSNPSLFILDEPDSGLDGVMARELMHELRRVADTGKIVIVITHTPDRVIDYFDDVIVLAKDSHRTGRLAFFGSIGEAREFFGCEQMEQIVKRINRKEEGGDGLADEYIKKYPEVHHA